MLQGKNIEWERRWKKVDGLVDAHHSYRCICADITKNNEVDEYG